MEGWDGIAAPVEAEERQLVIFFRKEGFYPLELLVNEDLAKHAELNPGTLRIEDVRGNVLWMPQ